MKYIPLFLLLYSLSSLSADSGLPKVIMVPIEQCFIYGAIAANIMGARKAGVPYRDYLEIQEVNLKDKGLSKDDIQYLFFTNLITRVYKQEKPVKDIQETMYKFSKECIENKGKVYTQEKVI
jgi:hypothetical protein